MKTIINEGLDYHDLEGQMDPIVSVDEYAATMGKDSEIVTLAFTIHSEQAGKDLVSWFERGYDWVLDASVSEGEVSRGKYLVFVELNRRAAVPGRIIELIDDLYTLTDLPLRDWNIRIDKEDHPADIESLKQFIIISPHKYSEEADVEDNEKEAELNEMRIAAGLPVKTIYNADDPEMKNFKAMAGL